MIYLKINIIIKQRKSKSIYGSICHLLNREYQVQYFRGKDLINKSSAVYYPTWSSTSIISLLRLRLNSRAKSV